MKRKRLSFSTGLLLVFLAQVAATKVTGTYQPASAAERGIWYTNTSLTPQYKAFFPNYMNENHLWYHLGKLTLEIDPTKDPDVHVYSLILLSPISNNTITSTVSWGGQQTSQISLMAAPRENNVVNTNHTWTLDAGNSHQNWYKISANNDSTEYTQATTIEIEFFIRTYNSYNDNGDNWFPKDKPIFFSNVDLRPGQIEFINSRVHPEVDRTTVQIDNADSFDYWGGAKVPSTEETWRDDSGHGQKQSLLLFVVDNTATIDPKHTHVAQPVAKLEIGTSDSNLPQKNYDLKIAMYDNDPIGTESSYYYLHLDDDKSNHNAFLVTLDVAGQKTLNDRNQTITLEIPRGANIPIQKLVSASFANQDKLPAGTYIDTVYVDIITGDK